MEKTVVNMHFSENLEATMGGSAPVTSVNIC